MTALESELRRHRRTNMTRPATVSRAGHTLAATLKNVSIGGVLLLTDVPFSTGSELEVVLMLPEELGQQSSESACYHGRVVRVGERSGQFAIAAQIQEIGNPV
ncbi:MAG: PilZ domain-containing protein [Acidobacteriia bacterium]|nr:PilZ domain-containing protein [Terriglobia bacterium]